MYNELDGALQTVGSDSGPHVYCTFVMQEMYVYQLPVKKSRLRDSFYLWRIFFVERWEAHRSRNPPPPQM